MMDGDQLCFETRSRHRGSILAATHRSFAFYVGFPKRSIRPLGLPIYVARRSRGSIVSRSLPLGSTGYPRGFTGHVAHPSRSIHSLLPSQFYLLCRWIPSSSVGLIRSNQQTVDRLTVNKSIHDLRDVRDCDATIKKVIGFD